MADYLLHHHKLRRHSYKKLDAKTSALWYNGRNLIVLVGSRHLFENIAYHTVNGVALCVFKHQEIHKWREEMQLLKTRNTHAQSIYASHRRISKNTQVDIHCNHVYRVGARCWGQGIAVKMAKQSSEELQKWAKCRASLQTQRYMLRWSHCCWWRKASLAATLMGRSPITLRVFGFDAGLRRKLVDFEDNKKAVTLTNTDQNCAHAIRVWWIYIYIHTNAKTDYTARLVASC